MNKMPVITLSKLELSALTPILTAFSSVERFKISHIQIKFKLTFKYAQYLVYLGIASGMILRTQKSYFFSINKSQ